MNQFVLTHESAIELRPFPQIIEIGVIKNSAIQLNGFPSITTSGIKFYYIQDGKFEWNINKQTYILYPGDVALILPGTELSSENNVLGIGSFSWIHIRDEKNNKEVLPENTWSNLSHEEYNAIRRILQMDHSPVMHKFLEGGSILKNIQSELFDQEIGYVSRVNHLLDEIFIQTTRQFTKISNPGRDFPKTFMKLEEELRRNLSHQWTVDEMATMVGLGSTLFNEKVKSFTGFSPLNYLINIRISEAVKLLKKPDISLTHIAFETGFYSSQHFSTTFKKLTGYSPSQFRKNHLQTK